MKIWGAIVLALLGVTACSHGTAVRSAQHVLRIADPADPTSLNPLLAHDQDTIGYDLLVTQTLIGLSASNRLTPVLVTRIPTPANGDVSPDGTTIVYHLRRDARFADGVPLTSADVLFTYRAILDPRNPVESQDAYRRIASMTAPDPHTVVVRLARRWNAAVAELFAQADFAFGILPAHAFSSLDLSRASWNERPFGTGPFRVVGWRRADRIVLEPNPYFRPRPKLQRIVLDLIPTTQAGLTALRSGDADVTEVPPAQILSARGAAGTHFVVTPVNGEYQLAVRVDAPPVDDVRVRRAISDALDRSQIVRGQYGAMTPGDSFLPPVFDWYDADPPSQHARPDLVAAELSAAGYERTGGWWTKEGHRLSVTIDLQRERGEDMIVVEQAQLRSAGIDAQLKTFPTSQFNAPDGPLRSGRFTLAATQWIGAADPEQSVILACSQRGGNGNNASNYCSPRFEALFNDQATTPDQARRRADFIAMQRIVRNDVPIAPIAFERWFDAVGDRVTGFKRNMLLFPVDPETWDAR